MFNRRKTMRSVCSLLIALIALIAVPQAQRPGRQAPVFTCRASAGMECAYTIHGLYATARFVLGSAESRRLDEQFIGAPYCVAWGRPRVPMPSWPQCLAEPNGPGHAHRVVLPGRTNS